MDFMTVLFEDGQLVRSKTSGLEMRIVGLWEPGAYVVEYTCGLWKDTDGYGDIILHDAFDLELVHKFDE